MMTIRIGIVAEGPTDQIIFKELLSEYCKLFRPDILPEFVNLQPTFDKTSGGGWLMVYKWCTNNPPRARHQQFFNSGLFNDDLNALICDVILVHLDTDICNLLGNKSDVVPIPTDESLPSVRGKYIYDTIQKWLWPDNAIPDVRHIPCVAVEKLETWIIAPFVTEKEPEKIKNACRRLVELDFKWKGQLERDDFYLNRWDSRIGIEVIQP